MSNRCWQLLHSFIHSFTSSTPFKQTKPWARTTNEEEAAEEAEAHADMEEDVAGAAAAAEEDVVERLIPTTTRIGMHAIGRLTIYLSIDRAFELAHFRSGY